MLVTVNLTPVFEEPFLWKNSGLSVLSLVGVSLSFPLSATTLLLVLIAVLPWRFPIYFINIIEFPSKNSLIKPNENIALLIRCLCPLCTLNFLCYYIPVTTTELEVPLLAKDPILLRMKYINDPPDGFTADDIRKMPLEDLLDLDYFLNEDVFDCDEADSVFFF